MNALSTTYYFYFIFFFLKREFDFDHFKNLVWAASLGLAFAVASILGGKVGQRWGYYKALGMGFATMAVSLSAGSFLRTEYGHLVVMLAAAFGMCFTWPNLEAMAAGKENSARLQRNLGIYNLIWSGGNGVAFFIGGAALEHLGPRSIFLIPAAIQMTLLILLWRMASQAHPQARQSGASATPMVHWSTAKERRRSPVPPATFMRMAWVANPFSYVAINTAVPLIPFLAGRLHLTPTEAGIVCSTWFFARTAAFGFLWKWDGWHYRFRFLCLAYVGMSAGFAGIVLAGNVVTLVVSQVMFGLALGLIYYSSLFYSMDVGDTKSEHGGWHEGAIGAGIFAGPAVAAVAIYYFPMDANAGIKAVGLLLVIGFGILNWLRWSHRAS